MLVPRRVSYLCCWGLLLSMTIRLSIDSALSDELKQIVQICSNSGCGKKSMERVVRLESVVETKHLAVSQTKTHILGEIFWGSLISGQFHTIPISCLTPLMANMYSRYNVYICTYIYILYIYTYIDCQSSDYDFDYDLDGTLYMWLPSETPDKRCCIQKKWWPPPKETYRNSGKLTTFGARFQWRKFDGLNLWLDGHTHTHNWITFTLEVAAESSNGQKSAPAAAGLIHQVVVDGDMSMSFMSYEIGSNSEQMFEITGLPWGIINV